MCLSTVLIPLLAIGTAAAPNSQFRQLQGQDFDPHSILVRFGAAESGSMRDSALAAVGGQILREYVIVPGLVHVRIDVPVEVALAALADFPGVLYVEPNYFVQLATTPNDPFFNRLWGMHNTGQTVK